MEPLNKGHLRTVKSTVYMGGAVRTSCTVRYMVGVRYSECPLKEVPLYKEYH